MFFEFILLFGLLLTFALCSFSLSCPFCLKMHSCITYKNLTSVQTKDLKGISIDLLVPGMMVNASVRSILENGIMLSFLTYFTGTVSLLYFSPVHQSFASLVSLFPSIHFYFVLLQADMFNLQQTFPSSSWKIDYPQNKKVITPHLPVLRRREVERILEECFK